MNEPASEEQSGFITELQIIDGNLLGLSIATDAGLTRNYLVDSRLDMPAGGLAHLTLHQRQGIPVTVAIKQFDDIPVVSAIRD